ncbi:MAG: toll/interleukin-1 receptor domain-containing protein, partial [Candidatus Acidiferrales bacterium]
MRLEMSDADIQYDVFLSYNWRDHAAVETVARSLREQGLKVFLDRWYLQPGRDWQQALVQALDTCRAVVVFLGTNGLGSWQQREQGLALDRQAREAAFPVIPVLLPGADPALGFLALNTWVDLREGLEAPHQLAVLAKAVQGEPPGPELQEQIAASRATVCPYRGLQPFREEDAPFFFGREAFTESLVRKVERHPLVAVVGASGSGKSSVVRAGLVPHLRKGGGQRIWDVVTLVPGDRPLHALAAALIPLLEPEMTETDRLAEVGKLAGHLAEGHVALRDVVDRILAKQPGTDRLLLVADQWEELYTLTADEQARRRFMDALLETTEKGRLSVVLTLRGDFFGHALSYRRLSDRLQDTVVNLGPMTRQELERAVERPAQEVGLAFEPGLTKRVVEDVGEEPGNLPLLEFALRSLWEERRAGKLLHEAYEAMGKVQGAMAKEADNVFEKLEPSEQEVAQRVFLQLVQPGEAAGDTRRRATFAEVGEQARPVVQKLADARLVVTGQDESTGKETIEVAHEALIRNWARLRSWVEPDRTYLLWRQRLRLALAEWERIGHDEGALLHRAPLAEAERWLTERRKDLNESERAFIQTSVALRERLRRRTMLGLAAGLVVALILTGIAGWQWWAAKQQHQVALARQLAAQSQFVLDNTGSGLVRSVLLAIESMEASPTLEGYLAWAGGMVLLPRPVARMAHGGWVRAVAFSPDGQRLATASEDNTAQVWEAATGREVAR